MQDPSERRRELLQAGAVLGLFAAAGAITPAQALAQQAAWNKAAFESKDVAGALRALGAASPAATDRIAIAAPDIAENGALVPITVTTGLPKVTQVAILVDKNPNPLAANFRLGPGLEPFVTTRVKMAQSADVHVLVRSEGRFYVARKAVGVTLGGCGA